MRSGTIAFLLGLLALHHQASLPAPGWALLLPLLPLPVLRWRWLRLPAWSIAGFLWGLLWAQPGPPLPEAERDLHVEGWIATLPQPLGRGVRFHLQSLRLTLDGRDIPWDGRLQLTWYDDPPPLQVGDRWRLMVRLRHSHGLRNPGGFDLERWLFLQQVSAQGYVRTSPAPQHLAAAERFPIERWRQRLTESFSHQLPGHSQLGVITALAIGHQAGIADRQWQVFNRTGTSHLIAISGSHLALVAGWVFVLVQALWRRWPALCLRLPARQAATLATLPVAVLYALLAGMPLPTQRALIMLLTAALALCWRRPLPPSRWLALAGLAVLLWDPRAPLSPGFWLSFGAVAVILYSLHGVRQAQGLATVRLQLVISLALLPLTALFFQQASLVSPLANLLAVPWIGFVTLPLVLLALLVGPVSAVAQGWLLSLAAATLDSLWPLLEAMSRWDWASHALPQPSLWTLLLAAPGLLWLLGPRGLPGRWLGAALCLPLAWPPLPRPAESAYWASVLEVGAGLAVVVHTRNHTLVYDTGPRYGPGADAGERVLLPFLRQQGTERVDALIVSHADGQHQGGVRSLLEGIPVGRRLTARPETVPIRDVEPCRTGLDWEWDGVRFQLLHPPPSGGYGVDNGSCVLRVSGPGGSLLLPGDVAAAGEGALLRQYGAALASDVLLAPQQGQGTPSRPEFLAAVAPRYVVFSTERGNRYGYPRPQTRAFYTRTGARLLDTAEDGAITFHFERDGLREPQRYREQALRYWHR
ncbi:MAG TPA: DNA internalization-related competence protein ComEC/Rec2 [Candidatus Competibacteraceae bacterium]|nr:DNA internalization-related competence protein ComEC/Rec2 [Candidatus Competibacteraceae bacterium]